MQPFGPPNATKERAQRSFRRRTLVACLVAAALIVPPTAGAVAQVVRAGEPPQAAAFAEINPVTPLTAASFADPDQNNMPWARWNFNPATATIAGLETDIQDAYDHNIAGLEIGQGGVPTNEQLTAIYAKAQALGITISLKAANGLPGATYAGTDSYARRTLGNYRLNVAAGQTITSTLPGPATGNLGTVVAVLAYQCSTAPCATAGTVSLNRSSVVDLTSTITGTNADGYQGGTTTGTVSWTAPAEPAGAAWVVLTFRAIPFGTQPETLSVEGTQQVTNAYDAYFAGGLGDLVIANGGDFFVDSHASDPWGAPEELWSSNMRAEFQNRTGYDILPDLAALVDSTMAGAGFGPNPPATALFYSFDDASGDRIRSDFNRVRSELFTENRLVPFQEWARTYNMKLRLQQEDGPYTSIGDQLQTSSVLDRSEYESLTGSDQADAYRPMASANHMTGNTWYSTECCAVLNQSYVETYQDAIIRMNKEFAGGVSRIVYHIRPYIDSPTSTWPGTGFSASKVGFSNAWNRTQPFWKDSAAVNDYFARNNLVLTQGAAKTDIAVYLRNYSAPSAFANRDNTNRHWQDLSLQQAGYTWDYLNEYLFRLPNATVSDGRLAVDGPEYKALVFDQFLLPSTNSAQGSLSIEAAEQILGYAQDGLPVIFVGAPEGTGSIAESDAELAPIVTEILALENVHQVASEADVPGKLAELGITPAAKPAAPTTLLSIHREDESAGVNLYYLYNQGVDYWPGPNSEFGKNPSNLYEEPAACVVQAGNNPCMATGEAVQTTVALEGTGVPYLLDTFSGQITPIGQYTRSGDTVSVKVSLERDASTVIALADASWLSGTKRDVAVESTTAAGAAWIGNQLVVRATEKGTYTSTLSNGKTVKSGVGPVPAAIDLTAQTWKLDAEDWQPTNPYGTTGEAGTATTKVPVSVTLTGLKSWPNIPELAHASGIGTYSTTFSLPSSWNNGKFGADLDLGQVTDTFTLKVNGTAVPIDQVTGHVELGSFLKAGKNSLEVTVATTLNNRLFALDTSVANRGVIQNYGLIGPVVLTPYAQAVVWEVKK